MDIGGIFFIIFIFSGLFLIIKYIYISNKDMSLDLYEDHDGAKNNIIIPFIITTILIVIPLLFWWSRGI